MTIEITKKQIIIVTSTIAIVLVTFFSGYFLGYHNGRSNTIDEYENKKVMVINSIQKK